LVASVAADSPAAHAGLKAGDLIVSVDGATVEDPNGFDYRFATKPLGGTAQIGIRRQGREMVVPVALQPIPNLPSDQVAVGGRSPFSGATVANLTPTLADQLRLDPQAGSVVITAVADGSAAESIGFRPGDVVVTVNNHKIERSADLSRIADSGSRTWRITIRRGDQQISVVFSG
jgi:S1-C subfamily serine protease